MKKLIFAAVSACALAACNPSAPGDAGGGGGGGFPDLTSTSYRAEAVVTDDGRTMPVVLMRDGVRQRMEMSADGVQSAFITNAQTGETFIVSTVGGQTRAMRASVGDFEDPALKWQGEISQTATRVGACSGAGQNGTEWTRDSDGSVETVCVTNDGIILRAALDGQTVWETTSVERGPQDAALFEVPQGVEVLDLGNMEGLMNEALQRAQGGQ